MQQVFMDFISLGFVSFILVVLFSICMFFIIREITLWYFRINENTETLKG